MNACIIVRLKVHGLTGQYQVILIHYTATAEETETNIVCLAHIGLVIQLVHHFLELEQLCQGPLPRRTGLLREVTRQNQDEHRCILTAHPHLPL